MFCLCPIFDFMDEDKTFFWHKNMTLLLWYLDKSWGKKRVITLIKKYMTKARSFHCHKRPNNNEILLAYFCTHVTTFFSRVNTKINRLNTLRRIKLQKQFMQKLRMTQNHSSKKVETQKVCTSSQYWFYAPKKCVYLYYHFVDSKMFVQYIYFLQPTYFNIYFLVFLCFY